MSFSIHQPVRFLLFWTLIIVSILLTQTIAQAAQVHLAWDPNDPAPDGYRVYARTQGQNYDYTSPVWPQPGGDPTQTTCTIDNLVGGASYYFVVRAYAGTDESGDSNEVNHILPTDPPTTYTITTNAGANGAISPTLATANAGDSQTFTISPDTGYHVDDVHVDGVSVGAVTTYTFSALDADHSISASFAVDTFTIQASAGPGGVISPPEAVGIPYGGSYTFTMTPNTGYKISDVVIDGISKGTIDTYTFSDVTADHTIDAAFTGDNQDPIADAGPDQTVDEGQTVTLSGLNSIDVDDGIAAFQWRQIQGIQVDLNSPSEPETTFTAPNVDTSGTALVFELSVTDYSGATTVDSCIVNVTWVNEPPIADVGVDQTVIEGAQVLLDASNSTDSDDGIASYRWRQINGPVVALSSANSAAPTFVAPDVASAGASLTFEVTVTDAGGLQDTDTCLINVTWVNTPPVADAGLDQSAAIGDEVFLDGSKSYDADDLVITSYKWYQANGVPVELSDPTAQSPMFIVPPGAEEGVPLTFELMVTDSGGLQGVDSCRVNVQFVDPAIYVSRITMQFKQKGPNVEANAYVTILDGAGMIVKEANVSGQWTLNGNPMNTITTTSKGDGVARLYSDKVAATPGAVFAIQITGVAKSGYTYDPFLNSVTEESLIVP
jgi:hypothetical protein